MSNTQKQNCGCRHINRHFLISSLLLLLSSFTLHIIPVVEGRPIPKVIGTAQKLGKVEEVINGARLRQIGSRPPRCERRCKAVQVPVAPQSHGVTISETNYYNGQMKMNYSTVGYYSTIDDFSNYKPMGWKCKCGNFLYNP